MLNDRFVQQQVYLSFPGCSLGKDIVMYFDQKEFGKRLKEIRMAHGITQEKLAEKLNVSWDYISRMERGTRSCSIDLLIAISRYFEVSTDYLLTGREMSIERNRILTVIRELTEIAQSL